MVSNTGLQDALANEPGEDVGLLTSYPGDAAAAESLITNRRVEGMSDPIQTAMNLMNVFIGSVMMTLPFVFASLGYVVGPTLLILVVITIWGGQSILTRSCHETGWRSYTELVQNELGHVMSYVVRIAFTVAYTGVLVACMKIVCDALVGTKESGYHGILPNLLKDKSGMSWYLSRWFVLLMVSILVLQPLVVQKRWCNLVSSSAAVVLLACTFGMFLLVLLVLGCIRDENAGLQAWMNNGLGGSSRKENCATNTVIQSITIIFGSFGSGFTLPSMMGEMKDYRKRTFDRVLFSSFGTTALIYIIIACTAAAIFGDHVQDDVLINLNSTSLGKFLPSSAAILSSYLLSLAYAIVVLLSFPVVNWAVREATSHLISGSPKPTGIMFYVITYVILVGAYCMALYVQSLHVVTGFVGGVGGATGALVPAMLAYRGKHGWYKGKVLTAVYGTMGLLLFCHDVVGRAWQMLFSGLIHCV